MSNPKYPIGTKVKYLYPHSSDCDKTGTIVDLHYVGKYVYPCLLLLNSTYNSYLTANKKVKCHVTCLWEDVEPLLIKNQQLLFDFMNEG